MKLHIEIKALRIDIAVTVALSGDKPAGEPAKVEAATVVAGTSKEPGVVSSSLGFATPGTNPWKWGRG